MKYLWDITVLKERKDLYLWILCLLAGIVMFVSKKWMKYFDYDKFVSEW